MVRRRNRPWLNDGVTIETVGQSRPGGGAGGVGVGWVVADMAGSLLRDGMIVE